MKQKPPARLLFVGDDTDDEPRGDTARQYHDQHDNRWTGLYDADGEPIMRPKLKIGFTAS